MHSGWQENWLPLVECETHEPLLNHHQVPVSVLDLTVPMTLLPDVYLKRVHEAVDALAVEVELAAPVFDHCHMASRRLESGEAAPAQAAPNVQGEVHPRRGIGRNRFDFAGALKAVLGAEQISLAQHFVRWCVCERIPRCPHHIQCRRIHWLIMQGRISQQSYPFRLHLRSAPLMYALGLSKLREVITRYGPRY
jgi:hypothetical protein